MPEFTGNDRSHDVREFLKLFEDIMIISRADETFKLLSLRRKLKEAAACLTRRPTAVTYEAERMLRARKWNQRSESMHHYVLEMDNLRWHMDTDRFTEVEFVDLIIEGMHFKDVHRAMLRGTNTVRELNNLLDAMKRIY